MGAHFPNGLDLNDATTDRRLVLERSLFTLPVALDRFSTSSYVRFAESSFEQHLVMVSATIGDDLLLRHNHFFGPVELRGVNVGDQLSVRNSEFKNTQLRNVKFPNSLVIDSATIGGSLDMIHARFFGDVILRAASIGSQVSLKKTRFFRHLNMNSIAVGESLLMGDGANYQSVDLRGAEIGNQLSAVASQFAGKLDMNSIAVGGNLIMKEQTQFSEVDLVGAKIRGTLSVADSIFKGNLHMDSAAIGGSLFMQKAEFHQPIYLRFLQVGSNLDLRATKLTSVDLTSARIVGDLRLGSSNVKDIIWKNRIDASGAEVPPAITLLNSSVGVLQDTKSTWPKELRRELQGFTYGVLGGFGTDAEDVAQARGSDWFIEWLNRDGSFSPQPYRHLAQVFVETGHANMAIEVLYGSRVRERAELNLSHLKWWMLWALQITVGFGYGYWNFLALGWAAVFVAIGTAVVYRIVNRPDVGKKECLGIWYSVDMLLPVIRLRERHYEIDLVGSARYYFFVHKIVGYLLTFFIIAGLSGLSQ